MRLSRSGLRSCSRPATAERATAWGWRVGLLLACWMLPGSAVAGEADVARVAGKLLNIGAGARAGGMGEAQAAVADDVYAQFWNPAGLTRLSQLQFGFMHNVWLGSLRGEYLAFSDPGQTDGYGISLQYLHFGHIPRYDIDANNYPVPLDGSYTPFTFVTGFSYALEAAPHLSVGATAKLISESMDTYNTLSLALDAGVQAQQVLPNLDAGLAVRNLGFPMQGFGLPLVVQGGLAYHLPAIFDAERDRWIVALDGCLPLPANQPLYLDLGTEFLVAGTLAVRLGYKLSEVNRLGAGTGLTAGIGVRLLSYAVDYAFQGFGELGATHRFSLTAGFGETKRTGRTARRTAVRTTRRAEVFDLSNEAMTPRLSGLAPRRSVSVEVQGEVDPTDPNQSSLRQVRFRFKVLPGVEVQKWTLQVLDPTGQPLKAYSGQGHPGEIVWDGRDEHNVRRGDTIFGTFGFTCSLAGAQDEQLTGWLLEKRTEEPAAEAPPAQLSPIYFDEGAYDLTSEARQAADAVAAVLASRPYQQILVDGYADGVTERDQAFLLSQRRVNAVSRYLSAQHRVPMKQMLLRARGSKNPVGAGTNAAGRKKNRRVEITIVYPR